MVGSIGSDSLHSVKSCEPASEATSQLVGQACKGKDILSGVDGCRRWFGDSRPGALILLRPPFPVSWLRRQAELR